MKKRCVVTAMCMAALLLCASCDALFPSKGGTLLIALPESSIAKYTVEVYYNRYDLIKEGTITGAQRMKYHVDFDGTYWVYYKSLEGTINEWQLVKVEVSGGGYIDVLLKSY